MDIAEKCSLIMLALAYVIIIMLITIYEVTECRFSRLVQSLIQEIILYLSTNIVDDFISSLPPRGLLIIVLEVIMATREKARKKPNRKPPQEASQQLL